MVSLAVEWQAVEGMWMNFHPPMQLALSFRSDGEGEKEAAAGVGELEFRAVETNHASATIREPSGTEMRREKPGRGGVLMGGF